MTRIEFDQLVENLERRFEGRTKALTRSAVTWALIGYLALITGLIASLGIIIGCVLLVSTAPNAATIKLGFLLGFAAAVIAWSILRGVWVRCGVPEGEIIVAKDAPSLFRLIEDTGKAAGGVPIEQVLITPDLNACVVQSPRFGIFGWHRNYLCLGIQLMDLMEPEEFRSVLAHEFAHLSKSHGRTGNWLYRIRNSWENVAKSLGQQGGILVRPLGLFFQWFWPRFNARAFVLSRANEYEADAFAASLTSPPVTISALTRIAIESLRLQENFWGKMDQRAATEPEPPRELFNEIAAFAREKIESGTASRWLTQQYARITDTSDTHPSLKDRISALGGAADSPPAMISESASARLLGHDVAERCRTLFSKNWRREHFKFWVECSEQARTNREKLEGLATKMAGAAETGEATAIWDTLRLQLEVHGVSAMRQDLAAFVESNPDHLEARYILGSHLLSVDEPSGVEMVERVAANLPIYAIDCYGVLAAYHDRQGNAAAIRELKRQADEHEVVMERAFRERHFLTKNDPFIPHGLTPDELSVAQSVLLSIPEVSAAWLVRKEVKEFPAWKSYALIVRFKFRTFEFISQKRIEELLQKILDGAALDGYIVIMQAKSETKAIWKKIRNIEAANIFNRQG